MEEQLIVRPCQMGLRLFQAKHQLRPTKAINNLVKVFLKGIVTLKACNSDMQALTKPEF